LARDITQTHSKWSEFIIRWKKETGWRAIHSEKEHSECHVSTFRCIQLGKTGNAGKIYGFREERLLGYTRDSGDWGSRI